MKHLLNFISAILIFVLVLISVLSFTFFNEKNIKKVFKENDYYDEIYSNIINNFEDNLVQSGLNIEIITNVIDKNIIQSEIDKMIDTLIEGKDFSFNSENIKINLDEKIKSQFENKTLTNEEKRNIEFLEDTLVKIYEEELFLSKEIVIKVSKYSVLIKKILKIAIIILIVVILLIITIRLVVSKTFSNLGIILLTSGIMSIISKLLIGHRYLNILIISETFSKMIINFITCYLTNVQVVGIILSILGLLVIIVTDLKLKNDDLPKLQKK